MKNLILSLALLVSSSASHAVVMMEIEKSDVTVNDIFTVNVIGKDFAKPLAGFGIDLDFNPSVLKLNSISIDDSWEFAKSTPKQQAGKAEDVGGASFFGVENKPGAPIKFARFEFMAIADGLSELLLKVADDKVFVWADSEGNSVTPEFVNSQIQVSSVPVPAAFWLMGSAMGWMMMLGRKRA